MYWDWTVLTKLFFSFVDLPDEVDESLTGFRYTLFWPVRKLELSYRPWLSILHCNNHHSMIYLSIYYLNLVKWNIILGVIILVRLFTFYLNMLSCNYYFQYFLRNTWRLKWLCAYPGICDFKFSQYILWHVVLCHRIHHEVLVSCWPLTGPVLMAFLL